MVARTQITVSDHKFNIWKYQIWLLKKLGWIDSKNKLENKRLSFITLDGHGSNNASNKKKHPQKSI